ncbi:hypothetical protein BH23CHL6_BH23CHL6_01710 [soil metagenome]
MLRGLGRGAPGTPAGQYPLRLCLDCRGYACANCWNEDAGFCQSCAPLETESESVPADIPEAPPAEPEVHPSQLAWPALDLAAGRSPADTDPEAEGIVEPEPEPLPDVDTAAQVDDLAVPADVAQQAADIYVADAPAAELEVEAVADEVETMAAAEGETRPEAAADVADALEPEAEQELATIEAVEVAGAEPEPESEPVPEAGAAEHVETPAVGELELPAPSGIEAAAEPQPVEEATAAAETSGQADDLGSAAAEGTVEQQAVLKASAIGPDQGFLGRVSRRLFGVGTGDRSGMPANAEDRLAEASYAEAHVEPESPGVPTDALADGMERSDLDLDALLAAAADFPIGEVAYGSADPAAPEPVQSRVESEPLAVAETGADFGPPVAIEAEAEPQAMTEAEIEPQVVAETEAEVEPLVVAETAAELEPLAPMVEVEAEARLAAVQAEAELQAMAEAEARLAAVQAEAELQAMAEAEARLAAVQAEAELEPVVVTGAEAELQSPEAVAAEVEALVVAETEAEPEPLEAVEAGAELQIEAEAEPQTVTEAEAEVEPVVVAETAAELEPPEAVEAEAEPQAVTEAEAAPQAVTEAEVEPFLSATEVAPVWVTGDSMPAPTPTPVIPWVLEEPAGTASVEPAATPAIETPSRPVMSFIPPTPGVTAAPAPGLAPVAKLSQHPQQITGTRACLNCQLPVSARVRFCRRCGSPQPDVAELGR